MAYHLHLLNAEPAAAAVQAMRILVFFFNKLAHRHAAGRAVVPTGGGSMQLRIFEDAEFAASLQAAIRARHAAPRAGRGR